MKHVSIDHTALETINEQSTVIHNSVLSFVIGDIVVIKGAWSTHFIVANLDLTTNKVVLATTHPETDELVEYSIDPRCVIHTADIALRTLNKKWEISLN